MITLEQAINLARQAHKGQWRRAKEPTMNDIALAAHLRLKDSVIINDGTKFEIKDGVMKTYAPYISHPLAVMNMMSTEEEKIVAVLHDVIEDTEAELDFQFNGIKYKDKYYELPGFICIALEVLTKPNNKSCSYETYINYISYNKLATKVKLADICHNLSCEPSEHAKQKYLKAMQILLKSI